MGVVNPADLEKAITIASTKYGLEFIVENVLVFPFAEVELNIEFVNNPDCDLKLWRSQKKI
ncbi:hypothetical protein [Nostoc sp.]|uniref:hypothetical protein n=1 Tax=Nostoc sp. TaxID=1180 RepID=UPI002FF7A357